jgi:phosphatidylserine/phosphatidylglycerophosphate/cardiolipin synthase-like enzyme
MNLEHREIGAAAARLAGRLPHSVTLAVAEAVAQHGHLNPSSARQAILQCLPTPDFRDMTADFLDDWHRRAANLGAQAAAVALVTAAHSEHNHRQQESVEIVWTGPEPAESRHNRFRHTEQAILEVVNLATKRLTIVSYAVYKIPRICEALVSAAHRGVRIHVIVETPNRIEGQGAYDSLRALGDKVASVCSVYYWPKENRPKDKDGKRGILHVKCAVADGHRLFLSSANLTDYAFTINMELGLLITGGPLPNRVDHHFKSLVADKVLVLV